MKKQLLDLIHDESGAGAVEYVVLSAVGVALALSVGTLLDDTTTGAAAAIKSNVGAASNQTLAP